MRKAIISVLCVMILGYYIVVLLKPGFYLKAMDNANVQQITMELGPPTRQSIDDKSQTRLVYSVGHIRPLCVKYVLIFKPMGTLQRWTWSMDCD